MDHVFRPDRADRIKHRLLHKLAYYETQFGVEGCVGCGRCVTSCIVKIDPVEVVSKLKEGSEAAKSIMRFHPHAEKRCPSENPYVSFPAVIKAIKQQTGDTNTYTLAFTDEQLQAKYTFEPGAFNMINVYGIGEAPISISSGADEKSSFEHTIRAVIRRGPRISAAYDPG
ncbi:MAG: hypothetical protein GX295_05715 [Syntrophomonadaceae bacterium]|nr:hypothetical protein [Syntrophomonadaceae bacterium]